MHAIETASRSDQHPARHHLALLFFLAQTPQHHNARHAQQINSDTRYSVEAKNFIVIAGLLTKQAQDMKHKIRNGQCHTREKIIIINKLIFFKNSAFELQLLQNLHGTQNFPISKSACSAKITHRRVPPSTLNQSRTSGVYSLVFEKGSKGWRIILAKLSPVRVVGC